MKNQFEEEYFNEVFTNFLIDGDYNAKFHINYILAYFELFEFKIKSILEIGFGNGNMLEEISKKAKLDRIIANEISELKTKELLKKRFIQKQNIAIINQNFLDIETKYLEQLPVDLCICNSVLQYIEEEKLDSFLNKISRISKYVYLTIPTKKDFQNLKIRLNFEDKYAFQREKVLYKNFIQKYFRTIGTNLLESKFLINDSILKQEFYLSN